MQWIDPLLNALIPETTGLDDKGFHNHPDGPVLYQNYPNPFNPDTQITFDLPEFSRVYLDIYSISGQKVVSLIDGAAMNRGRHVESFNSDGFSSGSYVFLLSSNGQSRAKIMTIVK